MRIEFRKSDGEKCRECGSYEFIRLADNTELSRDLKLWVAEYVNGLAGDLAAIWSEEKKNLQGGLLDELEKKLAHLIKEEDMGYFKTRWVSRIEKDIDQIIKEMREATISV